MLLAPKTEEGARSPGARCPQKLDTRPRRKYGLSSETPEGTGPLTP